MGGRKMAKSAGNFQRVTELVERGIDPLAFRYLVLTSRYGRKLKYSDRRSTRPRAALESLRAGLAALGPPPADGPWAAPPVLRGRRAPAIGRRASPTGAAGHGGGGDAAASDRRPGARAGRSPVARRAAPCTTGSSAAHRRRPRPAGGPGAASARSCAPTCPPTSAAGWSSTPTPSWGSTSHRVWEAPATTAARPIAPPEVSDAASTARDAPLGPTATAPAPTRSAPSSTALGWDVIDGPTAARRHAASDRAARVLSG